jgi:transcriptional regulator with PAS, ATPase and Fis domain
VGLAEPMRDIISSARRIAATKIPVLISGESGAGKEVLAHFIHQQSPSASKPFVAFNCATVPRDLIDSQLFGYRKGAFTGACEHFPGVIRAASGGTLFLDEVGELSREVQPKLLRFLESAEVNPLGETHPIAVKVRIIAATNADLDQLTRDGHFREDLFYRLSVVRYRIPPLRERREEIPVLVGYFLDKFSQEFGKTDLRIAQPTLDSLVRFAWPGNIRQLANELRRAVALAENGAVIEREHLTPELQGADPPIKVSADPSPQPELTVRLDQPLASAVQLLERSMLAYALRTTEGKVESAAKLLGVSRKGLYLKRHRFGLLEPTEGKYEKVDRQE